MVNMVEHPLKIDDKPDIKAANILAIIKPLNPLGINVSTSFGYAIFQHPTRFWHIFSQTSGSMQAISSVYNIREIIPGIIIKNNGINLRKPANNVPP